MKNREKILVISPQIPEFDKYAGWARLSRMLDMLGRRYQVFFCAERAHIGYRGEDDTYTLPLKE